MVPGRLPPDDPREWLNRARSSLAKAREGAAFPEIYLEDLCFDAQQAAEKAIKALLLHLGVGFPSGWLMWSWRGRRRSWTQYRRAFPEIPLCQDIGDG